MRYTNSDLINSVTSRVQKVEALPVLSPKRYVLNVNFRISSLTFPCNTYFFFLFDV